MLVVRVELHSAITDEITGEITGEITEIARMSIANDGKGTRTTGNYTGKVIAGKGEPWPIDRIYDDRPFRTGRVENYPRLREHVWNLVAKMLGSMGYK